MRHILTASAIAVVLVNSGTAQTPSASPAASTAKSLPQIPMSRGYEPPCHQVVDVCDVLAQYASLTHLKIIRDNFVTGKVSLDDVSKLPPEKAIEIIERTLFSNWYQLTQIDPDTVEVTGTGKSARSIGIPVISDGKALPAHERLVSFVFGFKYRDAQEMRQFFGQYLSPPQPWTFFYAEPKSNTVLVTERTSVIRQLIDIAAKMDVPDWQKKP
jgi:type II secretory pathway component GspD/PulD (secretin)